MAETSLAATPPPTTASPSARVPKPRSCAGCRHRKVRCDKQSPCSNCRRANVPCVSLPTDRPPKWARRLERLAQNAAASNAAAPQESDAGVEKVMDRLRNLESLVKDLTAQLEQAHAAATLGDVPLSGANTASVNSPESLDKEYDPRNLRNSSPASEASSVQQHFGRLVVQDVNHRRYVSSGFWSRVNDEIDGLKMVTRGLAEADVSDSSDDEASPGKSLSNRDVDQTPWLRNAFLFGNNLNPSGPDIREFHPLPSQIPFLLDVFSENINFVIQIVHMPTITKMVRESRSSGKMLFTPANEALMFSIYYATVASMEEEDIMTNFGTSKADLSLKFRLGLEHALAKADFLNAPDIVLVQAFTLFLCLLRRHDSPRFVWMMTGLAIRMAQYLGLQRDGIHFEHLTPFEIEMRRKVWWAVCMLDIRASEDQGTEMTISTGSFDTAIPLNLNDEDIDPESKHTPSEREGITDMTFARICFGMGDITRQMMDLSAKHGAAALEDQSRLVDEIYRKFEHGYFQYSMEPGNIRYWVGVSVARLVMAKLTLIHFFPVLFSQLNEHNTDKIRSKLLTSAIEVAEYNHALNEEQACRQWRWVYQTHTHWHAIVYLMIEISRRPWSPMVERAWVALHSSWLIPAETPMDENSRIWVPLQRLMTKARKHRDAELTRLQADPQAAASLEREDQKFPVPSSSGPFPTASGVDVFRQRWRQLIGLPQAHEPISEGLTVPLTYPHVSAQTFLFANGLNDSNANMAFDATFPGTSGQNNHLDRANTNSLDLKSGIGSINSRSELGAKHVGHLPDPSLVLPSNQADGRAMGWSLAPWLWADDDSSADVFANVDVNSTDVKMDLDSELDWYNWVESAKGIQWDAVPYVNGQT